MTNIGIDSGIALPPPAPSGGRGGRKRKYPVDKLTPGDSFFVPAIERDADAIRGSLATAISRMKNENPGRDYATRLWVENEQRGIRVWRTA